MGCDTLTMGQDTEDMVPVVLIVTFLFSISGCVGTQGHRGGLRVEGQQDTKEPSWAKHSSGSLYVL